MILISKGREPLSLTQHKKQPYASFDNCNKEDIRANLLKEQGYLCAYCMRRITREHMKIEHWYPESLLDEAGRMDYSRMLGCCAGHMDGGRHEDDTCDTHKEDTIITLNPQNSDHDINVTLNLNCKAQHLKENRKALLDTLKKHLIKKGMLERRDWEKLLRLYSNVGNDEHKREYSGIAIWYIQRKLEKV